MKDSEFSQMPYRNVLLIGVGTVFGSLGAILAGMLVIGVLWPPVPDSGLIELFRAISIYAIVGAMIAAVICLVLVAPMLLLWHPVFILFRRRGYALPQAAMASAAGMSFFGAVGVCAFAELKGAAHFPPLVWPFVMVPVGISVFLANYLSFDRSGAVWE